MGRIASGKSTLARALGRELGWEVLSSDRTRKELAGVALFVRGGPTVRKRLYSEAMTKKTYKTLLRYATSRVKQGVSIILDATFSRRHHRDELRRLLERTGATYCFIEAQAPEKIVKKRLQEREGVSHEVSDARLENFGMLNRSYEAPSFLLAQLKAERAGAQLIINPHDYRPRTYPACIPFLRYNLFN